MPLKNRRRVRQDHVVMRPQISARAGVELVVTYKGLDPAKDLQISRALGKHETGSGMRFGGEGVRDFTATVPKDFYRTVRLRLKAIRGIQVHRMVQKWVRVP